ncbi:MAG: hypothetical protein AABZ39_21240 [Spirochaetota bacterium]
MGQFIRILTAGIASLLVTAPAFGLDITWKQTLWRTAAATAVASNTAIEPFSTRYSDDSSLYFCCPDWRTNGSVILRPLVNYWPSYIASSGDFSSYGWNDWYQNYLSYSRYFDATTSVDGAGCYKLGIESTNTTSAIQAHRNKDNRNTHATMTHESNAFFMFYSKSVNPPGAPTPANLSLSVIICQGEFAYKGHTVYGFDNASPSWTDWGMNCGQFNYNTNSLRLLPLTNVDGWFYASNYIGAYLNVNSFFNRTGAAFGVPISNTFWVDEPIFAYDLAPSGSFISSPIEVASSYTTNNTNHVFRCIKSLAFSGIQGLYCTNGIGFTKITNTNANYYANVLIKLQVRGGDSLADLASQPWVGPSGAGTYFTNTPGASNISSLAGLKTNGSYFQYRVEFESAMQGVTPLLTNVALTFDYKPLATAIFTNPAPAAWLTNGTFIIAGRTYPPNNVFVYFSTNGISFNLANTNVAGAWWTNLSLASISGGVTLTTVASNSSIADMITNTQVVNIDTTAPAAGITNLTAGAVVANPPFPFYFAFTGTNADPESGIAVTRCIITNTSGAVTNVPATVTGGGFACNWNSQTVPVGNYFIYVVTTNTAGNFRESPSIPFTVAAQPPAYTSQTNLANAVAIYSPYRGVGPGIVFANLEPTTTVTIFTMSGKKLKELRPPETGGEGWLLWDLTTLDNRRASRGVYVCVLAFRRETRTMKVMISR